jgi:hypothetical protein
MNTILWTIKKWLYSMSFKMHRWYATQCIPHTDDTPHNVYLTPMIRHTMYTSHRWYATQCIPHTSLVAQFKLTWQDFLCILTVQCNGTRGMTFHEVTASRKAAALLCQARGNSAYLWPQHAAPQVMPFAIHKGCYATLCTLHRASLIMKLLSGSVFTTQCNILWVHRAAARYTLLHNAQTIFSSTIAVN